MTAPKSSRRSIDADFGQHGWLVEGTLPWSVVTCEEAARARGIPLERELKTLILRTTRGLVAAELRGHARLDLRRVKNLFGVREARLADPQDLSSLGVRPGTVSALLEPIWSLPHLVSRSLLDLEEVMTNNGSTTGYFAFDPIRFLDARFIIVGDFEAENPPVPNRKCP